MTPIQIILCFIILLSFYNYNRIEKYNNTIIYPLYNYIDGIIYITINNNKNIILEKQLKTFNCYYENLIIKYTKNNIVCAQNHINAINIAKKNKWKNVLIIDNNFMFNNYINYKEIFYNILHKLKNNFDILILSGTINKYYSTNINSQLLQVFNSNNPNAYMITDKYYDILINNLTKYCNNQNTIQPTNLIQKSIWNLINPLNNWYIIYPNIGYIQHKYPKINYNKTNNYLQCMTI